MFVFLGHSRNPGTKPQNQLSRKEIQKKNRTESFSAFQTFSCAPLSYMEQFNIDAWYIDMAWRSMIMTELCLNMKVPKVYNFLMLAQGYMDIIMIDQCWLISSIFIDINIDLNSRHKKMQARQSWYICIGLYLLN